MVNNIKSFTEVNKQSSNNVIDHNVLSNGFISNNIPEHVWSPNFLNGRKQFVKIGTNSVSNTTVVGAGSPQGTVSIMTSNLL